MQNRWITSRLEARLHKGFVEILFGARQTGKTTLLRSLLNPDLEYNLADPRERTRLLANPGAFIGECEALPEDGHPKIVFVDEAQTVPSVFDSVQTLYDNSPHRWKFVLCGSSARKLRWAGTNLLPGRSILHRLYPLILAERPASVSKTKQTIVPIPAPDPQNPFRAAGLEERLAYGELPGIAELDDDEERRLVLQSYSEIHLQEEIRREALVKDWGAFVNFLRLAARESGGLLNYSGISREVGVSVPTVKGYYQLLEDMFMGFSIPAFSGSPRKSVLSTPRFMFLDLGVRHAAAGIPPGYEIVSVDPGRLIEQWVGSELYKRLCYLGEGRLCYLRTRHGAEIDFIVEYRDTVIPVEVKWTEHPSRKDIRHLRPFLAETPNAKEGFVVCRCPRPIRLDKRILAIPWHDI